MSRKEKRAEAKLYKTWWGRWDHTPVKSDQYDRRETGKSLTGPVGALLLPILSGRDTRQISATESSKRKEPSLLGGQLRFGCYECPDQANLPEPAAIRTNSGQRCRVSGMLHRVRWHGSLQTEGDAQVLGHYDQATLTTPAASRTSSKRR